jgi:hypothetical protein
LPFALSTSVWNSARDAVERSAGELLIANAAASPAGRWGL